jgi:GTPase Era involved in 16S rRNA processing
VKYEDKVKEILTKVEKQKESIDKIVNSDNKGLIFNSEIKSKLDNLQKQINPIYEKLEKNEFEIAIVGQEDSGKSSLLNALVKTDIFPSDSGRTTYTSTKLIYGKEDKVEISFYTKDEFVNSFNNRLKSIGINGLNFENINLLIFQEKFDRLKKKAKNNSNYEEVKEIIKEKANISKLLEEKLGKIEVFQGENIDDFKSYIIGDGEDKSKPRVVKDMTIYSSKLQKLDTAIIYDVPGFNSPTRLHKEQTQKMLKKADSIIFISDITSPNIKGDELDLLQNSQDEYGISLKEKLFIFGNKLDNANNFNESISNIKKFENDLKDKLEISKNIFNGSAGKYLVDNKVGNLDITFKYETDDNIDKFRDSIERYYQVDRFNILKKQLENIQDEILELFKSIQNEIQLPKKITKRSLERKIESNAEKQIRNRLECNLNSIKKELKDEYEKNRYFSDGFINEVPNFFKEIDDKKIDELIPKYEDDFDTINRILRHDYLHNSFLDDFSNLVSKIVDNRTEEVEKRVLKSFVNAIKDDKDIERMAKEVFKFEQQSGKFDYLFERFGRKMLDLIIYNPVMGSKRETDYKEYKDEFLYLDSKYKNDGSILNMVVSGKDEPLSKEINIKDFRDDLINCIDKIRDSRTDTASCFESIVLPKLEIFESINNSFNEDELFSNRTGNYSKEDVKEEINRDINNFKNVLIKAIIPILDLETVFIKRVEKEIRVLISKLNDNEDINNFILDSLDIYLEEELSKIDEKIEDYESKKAILAEVSEFLKDNG